MKTIELLMIIIILLGLIYFIPNINQFSIGGGAYSRAGLVRCDTFNDNATQKCKWDRNYNNKKKQEGQVPFSLCIGSPNCEVYPNKGLNPFHSYADYNEVNAIGNMVIKNIFQFHYALSNYFTVGAYNTWSTEELQGVHDLSSDRDAMSIITSKFNVFSHDKGEEDGILNGIVDQFKDTLFPYFKQKVTSTKNPKDGTLKILKKPSTMKSPALPYNILHFGNVDSVKQKNYFSIDTSKEAGIQAVTKLSLKTDNIIKIKGGDIWTPLYLRQILYPREQRYKMAKLTPGLKVFELHLKESVRGFLFRDRGEQEPKDDKGKRLQARIIDPKKNYAHMTLANFDNGGYKHGAKFEYFIKINMLPKTGQSGLPKKACYISISERSFSPSRKYKPNRDNKEHYLRVKGLLYMFLVIDLLADYNADYMKNNFVKLNGDELTDVLDDSNLCKRHACTDSSHAAFLHEFELWATFRNTLANIFGEPDAQVEYKLANLASGGGDHSNHHSAAQEAEKKVRQSKKQNYTFQVYDRIQSIFSTSFKAIDNKTIVHGPSEVTINYDPPTTADQKIRGDKLYIHDITGYDFRTISTMPPIFTSPTDQRIADVLKTSDAAKVNEYRNAYFIDYLNYIYNLNDALLKIYHNPPAQASECTTKGRNFIAILVSGAHIMNEKETWSNFETEVKEFNKLRFRFDDRNQGQTACKYNDTTKKYDDSSGCVVPCQPYIQGNKTPDCSTQKPFQCRNYKNNDCFYDPYLKSLPIPVAPTTPTPGGKIPISKCAVKDLRTCLAKSCAGVVDANAKHGCQKHCNDTCGGVSNFPAIGGKTPLLNKCIAHCKRGGGGDDSGICMRKCLADNPPQPHKWTCASGGAGASGCIIDKDGKHASQLNCLDNCPEDTSPPPPTHTPPPTPVIHKCTSICKDKEGCALINNKKCMHGFQNEGQCLRYGAKHNNHTEWCSDCEGKCRIKCKKADIGDWTKCSSECIDNKC